MLTLKNFLYHFSHSLAVPTIIFHQSQSVKIMVNVSLTRRTEQVAKHVDYENACSLECRKVALDMVEDQIGSKFTVCCRNSSKQQKIDMEKDPSQLHQIKCI